MRNRSEYWNYSQLIMKKNKIIIILALALICIIMGFLFIDLSNEKRFASYVGSKNSNIYHDFNCSLVKEIKEEDKIWFDATIVNEGARYKGNQYFPCNVCKPPYKKEK